MPGDDHGHPCNARCAEGSSHVGRREDGRSWSERPSHERLNGERCEQHHGHRNGGLLPTQASTKPEDQSKHTHRPEGQRHGAGHPAASTHGRAMVVQPSSETFTLYPIKQQDHAEEEGFDAKQR